MPSHRLSPLSLLVLIVGCLPDEPGPGPEASDPAPDVDAGSTSSDGEERPPGTRDPTDPEMAACLKKAAAAEGVLSTRCSACHDNGQIQGGLGDITALDGLLGSYVVRGDADSSTIYQKVVSEEMPRNGEPLDDDELTALREWIDGCTLLVAEDDPSLTEPPRCLDNVAVPLQAQLAAMRDDIVLLDKATARGTRYLNLAHLHGAGYCESQIDGYRHALAKLLNHLSLDTRIEELITIDEAQTIYRINLDDYGWSPDTWRLITDSDPYAIVFESEDASDIQALSEVDLFSIKADWFIDAGSQPPLYHDILELPKTRFELEALLGINVDQNISDELDFDQNEVARVGFLKSGVSFSNRVLERHQQPTASYRAYWLSYDFALAPPGVALGPEKSILESPLDFVEDGGEIIFNLPNGLQAYMLVDAAGNRIDKGPINVVLDKEVTQEAEIINGLSCMSCHSEGMRLAPSDEVAPYVIGNTLFDITEQQDVSDLYTPARPFNKLMQQDIATFVDAMAGTGALRQVDGKEPIMAAHLAFDTSFDLRRAAAEFGVSENELRENLSSLQELTSLDKATVTRDDFEASFAFNACVLKLGKTFDLNNQLIVCGNASDD